MKNDKKERLSIWMPPSVTALIDRLISESGNASRSEFVCDAVRFYGGYLQNKSCEDYITKGILSQLDDRFNLHQKNVCRTLFKLAVEVAMHMHVTAEISEMGSAYLKDLRQKCIADVKKSLGTVRFDDIYEYHAGLEGMRSEEKLEG